MCFWHLFSVWWLFERQQQRCSEVAGWSEIHIPVGFWTQRQARQSCHLLADRPDRSCLLETKFAYLCVYRHKSCYHQHQHCSVFTYTSCCDFVFCRIVTNARKSFSLMTQSTTAGPAERASVTPVPQKPGRSQRGAGALTLSESVMHVFKTGESQLVYTLRPLLFSFT